MSWVGRGMRRRTRGERKESHAHVVNFGPQAEEVVGQLRKSNGQSVLGSDSRPRKSVLAKRNGLQGRKRKHKKKLENKQQNTYVPSPPNLTLHKLLLVRLLASSELPLLTALDLQRLRTFTRKARLDVPKRDIDLFSSIRKVGRRGRGQERRQVRWQPQGLGRARVRSRCRVERKSTVARRVKQLVAEGNPKKKKEKPISHGSLVDSWISFKPEGGRLICIKEKGV